MVRRICPDKAIAGSPMLFQGASISDVPPAGCKEAPEFVSILPRESAVAYGKSDEIHVSCVIGIDPDKKGGKLDMIRELQDPVITDVFQVNALLTAEDKAVDNKAGLAQADAEDGSPSSSVPLTGSVSGGISEETRGLFAKLAGGSPGSQTRINEL